MYYRMHDGVGWGFPLVMLLFTAAIVGLIVYLFTTAGRASGRQTPPPAPPHPPASHGAEAILAERFARGEIDDATYLRQLTVLRGGAPARDPGPPATDPSAGRRRRGSPPAPTAS